MDMYMHIHMWFVSRIIAKFSKKDLPKQLGRWNIDYCNTKLDNKIDWSNEDHCGPCGQYALNKIDIMKTPERRTSIGGSRIIRR